MRRTYIPFAIGMATMLLLAALVTAALAGEEQAPAEAAAPQAGELDGRVAYGQAGVALFNKVRVKAGETRTAASGAQVPTVLTYTDEKGGQRHYVDAETVAELLDVACGVSYNEALQCVDFGTEVLTDENGNPRLDKDGKPSLWTSEDRLGMSLTTVGGKTFGKLEGASVSVGGVSITSMDTDSPEYRDYLESLPPELRADEEARRQKRIERLMATPTAPEYGVTCGIFTEADPAEADLATSSGSIMDGDSFRSEREVVHTFAFSPLLGAYAHITLENEGESDLLMQLERRWTVGVYPGGESRFTTVRVVEDGPALENRLEVTAETIGGGEVQVRLSAEQFRSAKAQ